MPNIPAAFRFLAVLVLLAAAAMTCTVPRAAGPKPPFVAVQGPVIIAHRGGSLEAPENTLAAFQHAVEVGSDWQEVDVTLSADDAVVVIHDDTLERTTTGRGPVVALTLEELKQLDAGRPTWGAAARERLAFFSVQPSDFGDRFVGQRIPLLSEVLAVPGTRLMIELKRIDPSREDRLVRGVADAVRAARAWDRVAIGSFESTLLWKMHDAEPSLPLVGIADSNVGIDAMLRLPLQVLAVRVDHGRAALESAPLGVAVWVWTLYSTAMADAAIEQGVHGLITDVPQAVVAHLRAPQDLVIRP